MFEDACRDPKLLDEGALNFVVVGAGATGVETAGALAELINETMVAEYPDLAVSSARIHLVDHGHTVLAPFSDRAHDYAEKVLRQAGVQLLLKTGVKEVGAGHVLLSDDTTIKTRVVVWAGGLMAAPLAGSTGLPQGHGGRIDVQPDLTVTGFPAIYVLGDGANTPDAAGGTLPQLGSVAKQAGTWAARNILADIAGQPRTAFRYHDQGIMAMITRRAAVAEIGANRHELDGWLAAAAWRGVHASLLSGMLNKVDAFVKWTWAHFSEDRGPQLLNRTDAKRIDWEDDTVDDEPLRTPPTVAAAKVATAGQATSGEKVAVAIPLAVADAASRSTDPTVKLTSPEPAPHMAPVTHSAANLPEALSREYDVIIIGTGAGGGTLARHLAASGKRILLLERGDFLPREKENWDAKAVFVENRYVSPDTWYDAGGKPFQPGVHYYVGGATKMYGAALFRLRKEDFKELRHHDGMSPAWPISYEDLEPYYTRAEKLFYVHGLRGADPTEPPASEPYPYPPVAHEPRIQDLSDRLAKAGFHPFPAPCGLLLNEKHRNMSVCLKCDTCDGYPCLVHAKADAEVTGVLPALAHPNVTLVRNARVIRLNTSPTGREVTEVVVDLHGHPLVFKGHIVALAAGAANSAKILLQSANDKHPDGLANGSDQVGRNFMFHNSQAMVALSRQPNPTVFQKTLSINDFYFGAADFPYPLGNIQMLGKSKGPMFRDDAPKFAPGWSLDMMARHALDFWLTTEDLPDPKNRITVAADGKIQLSYTPNNQEPTRRLLAKLEDMLSHLDCHHHLIPNNMYLSKSIPIAGVGHQVGTCRFGTDPKTSVLDVNCKAHELDNLYVVDTSFFVSIGAVNPSLTAIANALRVGDHLLERLR